MPVFVVLQPVGAHRKTHERQVVISYQTGKEVEGKRGKIWIGISG